MDLRWGQGVAAMDGWVGSLDGAGVSLDGNRVTHLVVRRGLIIRRRFVVPMVRLARWDQDGLYLDFPILELFSLPTSSETDDWPSTTALTGRTRVILADGSRLRLRGLRLSREKPALTHLLVSRTRPGQRSLLLAAAAIVNIGSSQVTVDLDEASVEALPICRPDRDIGSDLWEALYASQEMSLVDLKGMTVLVEDGIVRLEGNVRTSGAAAEAERTAWSVDGVADVNNLLFSDWDIDLAVASHISREAPGLAGGIAVHTHLGSVQLEGHVPTVEARNTTSRGIRSISGVRRVEDLMEVRGPAPEAPGHRETPRSTQPQDGDARQEG